MWRGLKSFYLPGLLLVVGGAPLEVVPAAGDPVHVGEADLQQQRVHVSPDPHSLVQVHRYPIKTRFEVPNSKCCGSGAFKAPGSGIRDGKIIKIRIREL